MELIILEDIILDCDLGYDDVVVLMIVIVLKDINLFVVMILVGN